MYISTLAPKSVAVVPPGHLVGLRTAGEEACTGARMPFVDGSAATSVNFDAIIEISKNRVSLLIAQIDGILA